MEEYAVIAFGGQLNLLAKFQTKITIRKVIKNRTHFHLGQRRAQRSCNYDYGSVSANRQLGQH